MHSKPSTGVKERGNLFLRRDLEIDDVEELEKTTYKQEIVQNNLEELEITHGKNSKVCKRLNSQNKT